MWPKKAYCKNIFSLGPSPNDQYWRHSVQLKGVSCLKHKVKNLKHIFNSIIHLSSIFHFFHSIDISIWAQLYFILHFEWNWHSLLYAADWNILVWSLFNSISFTYWLQLYLNLKWRWWHPLWVDTSWLNLSPTLKLISASKGYFPNL